MAKPKSRAQTAAPIVPASPPAPSEPDYSIHDSEEVAEAFAEAHGKSNGVARSLLATTLRKVAEDVHAGVSIVTALSRAADDLDATEEAEDFDTSTEALVKSK